jgi:hypothetical protein
VNDKKMHLDISSTESEDLETIIHLQEDGIKKPQVNKRRFEENLEKKWWQPTDIFCHREACKKMNPGGDSSMKRLTDIGGPLQLTIKQYQINLSPCDFNGKNCALRNESNGMFKNNKKRVG